MTKNQGLSADCLRLRTTTRWNPVEAVLRAEIVRDTFHVLGPPPEEISASERSGKAPCDVTRISRGSGGGRAERTNERVTWLVTLMVRFVQSPAMMRGAAEGGKLIFKKTRHNFLFLFEQDSREVCAEVLPSEAKAKGELSFK